MSSLELATKRGAPSSDENHTRLLSILDKLDNHWENCTHEHCKQLRGEILTKRAGSVRGEPL